jgi:hypothetical protein
MNTRREIYGRPNILDMPAFASASATSVSEGSPEELSKDLDRWIQDARMEASVKAVYSQSHFGTAIIPGDRYPHSRE